MNRDHLVDAIATLNARAKAYGEGLRAGHQKLPEPTGNRFGAVTLGNDVIGRLRHEHAALLAFAAVTCGIDEADVTIQVLVTHLLRRLDEGDDDG